MIYTVKDFSIFNEAEVYVFLEFSCFFYDPMDVGSLISGIKIWKCIINIFTNLIHTHTYTHSYCKCEIKYLRKIYLAPKQKIALEKNILAPELKI